MGKTAFVFPGQGSQEPGMVEEFADAWPGVMEQLERIGSEDLQHLLFDADAETLRETSNTQQSVLATGLAVERTVRDRTGIEPDFVAGHSLGHITAAASAGLLAPTDAVDLVEDRGRLMAMAEREAGPGTMVAVTLAGHDAVESALSEFETVSVAGFNSPRQTVISGPTAAVQEAAAAIEDEVARARTTELDVGSAFHSRVMDPAVDPFEEVLAETSMQRAETPIVSDVTGAVYRDPETAGAQLGRQLTSPIRWTDVVESLVERGVDRVIELPPAGTLSTLTERTTDELEVVALSTPAALGEVSAHA